MARSPANLAKRLLAILRADQPRLEHLDNYLHGRHAQPYQPDSADAEYRLLSKRAVTNQLPLVVSTVAQMLFVDGVRSGDATIDDEQAPQWDAWQRSSMDARQDGIHRAALTYGHSFVLVERKSERTVFRGLSPMRTAALYRDPAGDSDPYAALTVEYWPDADLDGLAYLYDASYVYEVVIKAEPEKLIVRRGVRHGMRSCPITRFASHVDLEGRTEGLIESLIPLQDRLNQTTFDLLVAQTYGSFVVRTVSGMAPPLKLDPETGEPVLDPATGHPVPLPISQAARSFIFAEDADTKFGALDPTPLEGYIAASRLAMEQLAAAAQVPPTSLLGQIANISAEALAAAESGFQRKVANLRATFGESYERCFRLAAELDGDIASAESFTGEVMWRDMTIQSLAQAADALGKFAKELEIPPRGLFRRVPGVRSAEIAEWIRLREEDDASAAVYSSSAPRRSTAPVTPDETAVEES